jgi:hypothetical protein
MKSIVMLIVFTIYLVGLCYGQQPAANDNSMHDMNMINTIAAKPLDTAAIEKITGIKGKENKGQYKITVPHNDLNVVVDGFKITPPMGLGTWVCFTPAPDGAMIMGDVVLTETDLAPFQQEVIRLGLSISAIHNHFLRNHPAVMYMHIGGMGNTDSMALKVKAVFNKITALRGKNPSSIPADSVINTIDIKKLDGIIGYKGEMSNGVYKYTIARPDVDLKEHGLAITSFGGFNTWAAWQGTDDNAAVAGDFTMLESEVEPVMRALIKNGIEIVALHNHMTHEQPRIFFLHYWGIGPAEKLSKGLRAALDETGKGIKLVH